MRATTHLSGALLVVAALGCQEAPTSSTTPAVAPDPAAAGLPDDALGKTGATLALSVAEQGPGYVLVDLVFNPAPGTALPRVAEVWLAHGPGMAYESVTALDATVKSGKTLVAQPKENGEVRTILYSAGSLATIQAGSIARYRFKVAEDGSPLWLEVKERMPTFAPVEANTGIMLPPRLQINRSSR